MSLLTRIAGIVSVQSFSVSNTLHSYFNEIFIIKKHHFSCDTNLYQTIPIKFQIYFSHFDSVALGIISSRGHKYWKNLWVSGKFVVTVREISHIKTKIENGLQIIIWLRSPNAEIKSLAFDWIFNRKIKRNVSFSVSDVFFCGASLWKLSGEVVTWTSRELKIEWHHIRGQSDKYLASPPEGATIARETYYRVVHSRSRLLSKFQSNRTRSLVLTACGNGRIRRVYKNGKRAISVGDSILVFGREVAQRNQRAIVCYVLWLFSFDGDRQKLV